MARKINCPNRKCKSVNIVPLDKEKKISLLGAAAGGYLLGPVGAVIGAAAGGKKTMTFRCMDCGTVFEEKI